MNHKVELVEKKDPIKKQLKACKSSNKDLLSWKKKLLKLNLFQFI